MSEALAEGVTRFLQSLRNERRLSQHTQSAYARDLAMLESAGYAVAGIHPYDFFPLTHHVEALALLDLHA